MILYPRSLAEVQRLAYVARGRALPGASGYAELLFWNPSGSGVDVLLQELSITIEGTMFVDLFIRTGGTEPFDNQVESSMSCYDVSVAGALEVHSQVPTSQTAPDGSDDFTFAQLYLGNIGALRTSLLPVPLRLQAGEGLWLRGNTVNIDMAAWVAHLEQ